MSSGDQDRKQRLGVRAIGKSSHSTVRCVRLYGICNPMNEDQPRRSASILACDFPLARPSAIIVVAVELLAHNVPVIRVIQGMNIASIDLNLLVIFRAIYAERNISRAAVALGKAVVALVERRV